MNKFEKNVLKANALVNVASAVQYAIDHCIEDIEMYKARALEETAEGEEPNPDSYWKKEWDREQEELNLWNDIAALLEKKLSK